MRPLDVQGFFDESPVALLYDRYAHIILHDVSRYLVTHQDADDVVLEVFLAALENQAWLTWGEDERLAWLRRVAHNKAIDAYRRVARHPVLPLENAAHLLSEDDSATPEYTAIRNEEHAVLRAHLSALTEKQQEIVRLRFGYGLRSKEIAQRLNTSDNVIRVLLSRALNSLRRMYSQEGGDS